MTFSVKREYFFYSWSDFSRLQAWLFAGIFFLFNYLRFVIQKPFLYSGDEAYHLKKMTEASSLSDVVHFAIIEPGKLLFGDHFLIWLVTPVIPKNIQVLYIIPNLIVSNLFLLIFIRVNWVYFITHGNSKCNNILRGCGTWISVIASLYVCLNLTLTYHALELRVYSYLPLFNMLAFVIAFRMWYRQTDFICNIILAFAIMNFHYYVAIMLSSWWLFLGSREWYIHRTTSASKRISVRDFQKPAAQLLISFVSMSPIWIYFLDSTSMMLNPHQYIQSGWRGISQVLALYFDCKPLRNISIPLLISGTIILLQRSRLSIGLLCMNVFLPTFAIYLLDLLNSYHFLQRQFLWVMPIWAVYVAVCWVVSIAWLKTRLTPMVSRGIHK